MNKQKKIIIYSILIVILIILVILMNISNIDKSEKKKQKIIQEQKEERIETLKKVPEGERIKKYIGTYFKKLEQRNYDEAYKFLYPKFKENYFPTLEKYIEYIEKEQYPQLFAIEYIDIKIKGKNYITKISISDMLNKEFEKIDKEILVQENDYDEFFISFQVE